MVVKRKTYILGLRPSNANTTETYVEHLNPKKVYEEDQLRLKQQLQKQKQQKSPQNGALSGSNASASQSSNLRTKAKAKEKQNPNPNKTKTTKTTTESYVEQLNSKKVYDHDQKKRTTKTKTKTKGKTAPSFTPPSSSLSSRRSRSKSPSSPSLLRSQSPSRSRSRTRSIAKSRDRSRSRTRLDPSAKKTVIHVEIETKNRDLAPGNSRTLSSSLPSALKTSTRERSRSLTRVVDPLNGNRNGKAVKSVQFDLRDDIDIEESVVTTSMSPTSKSTSPFDIESKLPTSSNIDMTLEEKERISTFLQQLKLGEEDLLSPVEMGYISYRAFLCMGGFLIIAATSVDYILSIRDLGYYIHPGLITVGILGFLVTQLEGRPYHVQFPIISQGILMAFPFLQRSWTRSIFYLLIGIYQLNQYTMYNMACAMGIIVLGLLSMLLDYVASMRLSSMHKSLKNNTNVAKYLFQELDGNTDGFLTTLEFKRMTLALNQNIKQNIFVAALAIIDVNNNQRVSIQDFLAWFEKKR